jgi:hypothetical protein
MPRRYLNVNFAQNNPFCFPTPRFQLVMNKSFLEAILKSALVKEMYGSGEIGNLRRVMLLWSIIFSAIE